MGLDRRRLFRIARIVASVALVGVALWGAGMFEAQSRARAWETVRAASVPMLVVSLLFIPLMDAVSTVKWKALAGARGLTVGYWRLLAFYIVGRFYNMVLPSSIGGDVIRISLLGRETNRVADAAAVVFVERLTGVIVLLVLAAVALVFAGLGVSEATLALGIVVAGIAIALFSWLLIGARPLAVLERLLGGSRGALASKALAKLAKLRNAIRAFRHHGGAIAVAFANSVLFYGFAIVNVWVTVLVFQDDVALVDMMIAVPLIMFIMNLPVSVGTLGILEFGYTVVLMQFGVHGEAAIATALLVRLKLVLAALIGAAVNATLSLPAPGEARVRELGLGE